MLGHIVSAGAVERRDLKGLPEKHFLRSEMVKCLALVTLKLSAREVLMWKAVSAKRMP